MNSILSIETSCDDSCVAILNEKGFVEHSEKISQHSTHQKFGGVVPELSSRDHTKNLMPLIESMMKKTQTDWSKISAIAVTNRPGLIGSLLVGLVTAKTLSMIHQKKLIGINHLEAHIWAPFLEDHSFKPQDLKTPFLSLSVSGGHTYLYLVHEFGKYEILGKTLDDAAGEALDKFAKKVGLGFPGGEKIDRLSLKGDPLSFHFPSPKAHSKDYNFSFSGLKTAAYKMSESMGEEKINDNLENLCASFQKVVIDSLMRNVEKAANELKIDQVSFTGGVCANSYFRKLIDEKKDKWKISYPPIPYCTDNAAMIAYVALKKMNLGQEDDLNLQAYPYNLKNDFL